MIKDKLFLIVYIDVRDIDPVDIGEYAGETAKHLRAGYPPEEVELLVVPVNESSRIECINPVLLTEEKYKEVDKTFKKFKKDFEDFIEKNKEE